MPRRSHTWKRVDVRNQIVLWFIQICSKSKILTDVTFENRHMSNFDSCHFEIHNIKVRLKLSVTRLLNFCLQEMWTFYRFENQKKYNLNCRIIIKIDLCERF